MDADEKLYLGTEALGRDNKSGRLFHEIFQDTSVGDIGIDIAGGPLLRCHSIILQEWEGFLQKVRSLPKVNRSVTDVIPASTVCDEIKKDPKLMRLKKDTEFSAFSLDTEKSCLASGYKHPAAKIRKPGYTTATNLSGTLCSYKNRDVFALAERYEVQEKMEHMIELLRYVYQGEIVYFYITPKNKFEQAELKDHIVEITFLADKYCIDSLLTECLEWFRDHAQRILGEDNLTDAYYRMEYHHRERTIDAINKAQFKEVLLLLLSDREQLRSATRDPRWTSTPYEVLETILSRDDLAIGGEEEILGLIERWNANADKSKSDLCAILNCFRVCSGNSAALKQAFSNLGYPSPQAGGYHRVMGEREPRDNLSQEQMSNLLREMAEQEQQQREEEMKKKKEQKEAVFIQFDDGHVVSRGFNFQVQEKQTIVQNVAIRASGLYRVRLAFSQSVSDMWNPDHEMFVGIIFGNKYFGYIVRQSPYTGVFRLQNFSSYAPKPGQAVNLTGSGTKVEFDLELGVSMQRVNKIVTCTLSAESNNTTLVSCPFQIHRHTLMHGTGLRYQILGSIPQPGLVDVSVAWVGQS